jgi:Ca-activated chloride channel homolog
MAAFHDAEISAMTLANRLSCARATLAALALMGSAPTAVQAQGSEPSSTILIFDGSGSMWGKLDGEKRATKLDMGRDGVKGAITSAPASARLGLMSFGHRRAADCSDIEVLSPLTAGDPARIGAALDKLNPRGKGPLAGALREAAKQMGSANPASVILIHDGPDNCRQDACQAANEIASAQPNLRLHVVGLALDPDDIPAVSCIAKAGRGKFFDARDGAAVAAAVAEAFQLATLDGTSGGGHTPPAGVSPPAKPVAVVPTGPSGLSLSASLAPGLPALMQPVRWRVMAAGGDQPVFEGTGATLLAPVPAGAYTVEGRVGFVSAKANFDVTPIGPTSASLVLNAAGLKIIARESKDGAPSASPIVSLSAATADAKARTNAGRPLWIGRANEADLVLPAGNYRVLIEDGLMMRDETLTLAMGSAVTHEFVLSTGRLELSASASTDGETIDGATFLIAKDDTEAVGGRREIARSAAKRATFVVPAGTYYITVRAGLAEVRQQVAVGAGDTVKRAISLGLTKLIVTGEAAGGKSVGKLPLVTRVWSMEGEPREIARSAVAAPEFLLAAGRYRVEAAVGAINVKASQDVDIEPGNARRLAFKFDASAVTLKLAGAAAARPQSDVVLELRNQDGALLLRTAQPSAQTILAPGRYQARCDIGDQRLEKTFDVLPGSEARVVEFAAP